MKALRATVFRSALGDHTLDGVSSKASMLYVVHPRGTVSATEVPSELLFELEQRGENYWALRPVFPSKKGVVMFGGNVALPYPYGGDKAPEMYLPAVMHIHDRVETDSEYEQFSR